MHLLQRINSIQYQPTFETPVRVTTSGMLFKYKMSKYALQQQVRTSPVPETHLLLRQIFQIQGTRMIRENFTTERQIGPFPT